MRAAIVCKQVWNLMPLDPMAWLVMYNEHHKALADLIASNMQHRLPLEAVRDAPPPPQVRACSGKVHKAGFQHERLQHRLLLEALEALPTQVCRTDST